MGWLLANYVVVVAGVIGGLARASFGAYKSVAAGREIHIWYFLVTVVLSGIIGGILGFVFNVDFRVAALAGFVGTDILENVAKGAIGGNVALGK